MAISLIGKLKTAAWGDRTLVSAVAATDGQLLERFAARRDAAAFEVVVRRHGPMVLRVCQRVLFDRHDAEDAFQATFLVLVRKAGSIANAELLGNWLHGVAHRIALKARDSKSRRLGNERRFAAAAPEPIATGKDPAWQNLRPVLDEELTRLPEKFRAPLVLCYLEGKTVDETADHLGWKRGTAASRLSRGRDMLRNRLARRGLALSAGALATLLTTDTASAALPASLAASTATAVTASAAATGGVSSQAIALADAFAKAVFWAKAKTYGLLAAVLILGGTVVWSMLSARTALPVSATGFVNRVWQAGTPQESKYVVFVPHSYRGDKPVPALLFLHGAAESGNDGELQLRQGLATAIKNREQDFPFITVFPQSPGLGKGAWDNDSEPLNRAMAILGQVEKDFNVDKERVSLVGFSMGGWGAWTLANKYPERWAAVVPVAGGGADASQAAKVAKLPIWAFHVADDAVISAKWDRDMIAAIRAAGGAPKYTEYPGVDHSAALAAFADPELYRWLLLQRRR